MASTVSRYLDSSLKYLEDLGRSVVGQGSPPTSTPDAGGKTSTADNSEYTTHTTTSPTTWHSFLLSRLKAPYTHILKPILALLATAFRALYVFLYHLTHNLSFTGGRFAPPEWTLLQDLPTMHLDRAYLFTLLTSPTILVRDYRRWRRRKGIRFAKPKVKVFVVDEEGESRDPDAEYEAEMRNRFKVLKRGGPHLGQENPFDYVSDDEEEWDSEGARERRSRQALERGVAEAGLRAEGEVRRDDGEDGGGGEKGVGGEKRVEGEERVQAEKGAEEKEEVRLEEHATPPENSGQERDVIARPKIGRKEAKRGHKKRRKRR